MKKLSLTTLIVFTFVSAYASLGTWTGRKSLPASRSTHVGFSINGKGYICGGALSDGTDLTELWEYDPALDSWSRKSDMPGVGRRELTVFVVGNYAYVGLGLNVNYGTDYTSMFRYDPSTDSWSAIADCPVRRYTAAGFGIDSIGYITCGFTKDGPRHKDLWAYNPRTNTWTQKSSLPSGASERSFPTVVSTNHKAYLFGGYDGSTISNELFEYDPVNDAWAQKANYPSGGRSNPAGFSIGKYVLFGMGRASGSSDKYDWHYFDPSNNTWTAVTNHPNDNTVGNASFTINGKGYVCGGWGVASGLVYTHVNEFSEASLGLDPSSENESAEIKPFFAEASSTLHCNNIQGVYEIIIYDACGKLIFSAIVDAESGNNITMDLSHLSKGMYIANFSSGIIRKSLKFVVQ